MLTAPSNKKANFRIDGTVNAATPTKYGDNMARTTNRLFTAQNTIAVGLITIAVSIALVGVVWASSTATDGNNDSGQISPSDSLLTDDPNSSPEEITIPPSSTDVNERLNALSDRIDQASREITELSDQLTAIEAISESNEQQISKLSSEIDALKIEIAEAVDDIRMTRRTVEGLNEKVSALASVVETKTLFINDEGKYTGGINPSQITPQLKVSDIIGKWPLDRTEGDLDVSKLYSDLFSCTSDFRTHAVISVDTFRRMTCLRIPK